MDHQNKVDAYLGKLKNHKVLAFVIIIGLLIIGLGNIFDAFNKIGSYWAGKPDKSETASVPPSNALLQAAQPELKTMIKYYLRGRAENLSSGNTDDATLTVTQLNEDKYFCEGRYGGKNLFGSFELHGLLVAADGPGLNLRFKGLISFGGADGSNYDQGTQATLDVRLNLDTVLNVSKGTYTVGKIPNSNWSSVEQQGLFTLAITSTELVLKK